MTRANLLKLALIWGIPTLAADYPMSMRVHQLEKAFLNATPDEAKKLIQEAMRLSPEEMKDVLSFALSKNPHPETRRLVIGQSTKMLRFLVSIKDQATLMDKIRKEDLIRVHYIGMVDALPRNRASSLEVFNILGPQGKTACSFLKAGLQDPDLSVQLAAVKGLRNCTHPSAPVSPEVHRACRDIVNHALKSNEPRIAAAGLAAALHTPDFGVLPKIEKALKSENAAIHQMALEALAGRPGREALKLKIYAIRNSSFKRQAILSLTGSSAQETLPTVIDLLNAPNPEVTRSALDLIRSPDFPLDTASMLELWKHPRARASLISHLNDKAEEIAFQQNVDKAKQWIRSNLEVIALALEDPALGTQAQQLALEIYSAVAPKKSAKEIESAQNPEQRAKLAKRLAPEARREAHLAPRANLIQSCVMKAQGFLDLFR